MPQFYRTGDPVKLYGDGRIATVLERRSSGNYLVLADGDSIPFVVDEDMFEATTRTPGAHAAEPANETLPRRIVATSTSDEEVPHGRLTTHSTPYITQLNKDDVEEDDGVIRGMLYGTGPVPVVPPGSIYDVTAVDEEEADVVPTPVLDRTIAEGRRKIEADLIEETTSTPEARLDITRTALIGALRTYGVDEESWLVARTLELFDRGVALGKAIGR